MGASLAAWRGATDGPLVYPVHWDPSQYRSCATRQGSANQPAGVCVLPGSAAVGLIGLVGGGLDGVAGVVELVELVGAGPVGASVEGAGAAGGEGAIAVGSP
jgi:hypothetical protein